MGCAPSDFSAVAAPAPGWPLRVTSRYLTASGATRIGRHPAGAEKPMVTRILAGEFAGRAGQSARRAARNVQQGAARAASGMLGLAGERMSKVDTAWLRMDSASNLM